MRTQRHQKSMVACSSLDADQLRNVRGSFAVVKEGRHKASGTRVAIKIVDKKDAVFDPESLEQEVGKAATEIGDDIRRSCSVMLET